MEGLAVLCKGPRVFEEGCHSFYAIFGAEEVG